MANVFDKLKKLFSTNVIVRNVGGRKLKVVDTDGMQSSAMAYLKDKYTRMYSTMYLGHMNDTNMLAYQTVRLELFRDYDCISGDTIIPTPDNKNLTIRELSEMYPDRKNKFYVFSYDIENKCIKLGEAHSARLVGKQQTYKITFDNEKTLIATDDHPVLMRDGQYKLVKNIKSGESIMPLELSLNHKIISIEKHEIIDVYDLTVDVYHNFATENGFVHNCMDKDPIIASALDIMADETASSNEYGEILTIQSPNDNIKNILYNLFYDVLNIEFNLWPWARNLYKYGDFYLIIEVVPEYGIHNVRPVSTYDMKRIENSDPGNPNYVYFQQESMGRDGKFENYQVAHFRLLSDSNWLPYGRSMIEPARRIWKQLSLMEDAMLIHRVMRAPEKRIFKIDIGNIPPNEVDAHMNRIIDKMKKTPFIDPQTGDYNLRFNLQNMVEDFFLPVRGGDSGTSIEPLSGMEFTGIDDIEYLRNKMMAALKVPKAFLNYEEGVSGKATLSMEDLRFAKTILRLQKIIISELTKLAVVHLFAQGFRNEELVNFSLQLTNPSTISETEKISLWGDKTALAKDMLDNKLFSKKWIYQNVFKLSGDDIDTEAERIIEDTKTMHRTKSIEEEGIDPALGDEGEESSGDGIEMGGQETPETPASEAPTTPEEIPPPEMKESKEPTKEDFEEWGREGGKIGGGRPKGMQNIYKTRKHHLGDDPLGHELNKQILDAGGNVRCENKQKVSINMDAFKSMEKQLEGVDFFIKELDKKLLSELKIIDEEK